MAGAETANLLASDPTLRGAWKGMLEPVAASLWRLWPRLSNHVRSTAVGHVPGAAAAESPLFLLDDLWAPLHALDRQTALWARRRPPPVRGPTGLWLDRLALREAARDRVLGLMWETAFQLVEQALDRTRDLPVPVTPDEEAPMQPPRVVLSDLRQQLLDLKVSWEDAALGGLVSSVDATRDV